MAGRSDWDPPPRFKLWVPGGLRSPPGLELWPRTSFPSPQQAGEQPLRFSLSLSEKVEPWPA